MEAETVDRIVGLKNKEHFQPQQEPGHVYYVKNADGGYDRVHADPMVRDYQATSVLGLASLIACLSEVIADPDSGEPRPGPVDVFIGTNHATAVMDEAGERRHKAVLELKRSAPFAMLKSGGIVGPHGTVVTELATTFRGMMPDESFLPLIRSLKWKNRADGSSEVKHTGGSYGIDVETAVTGNAGAAIPEEIRFSVPIFETVPEVAAPFDAEVLCSVTANPAEQKFAIRPLPGEVERAEALARREVERVLEELTRGYPGEITLHIDADFRV